jgi:predicted nuclease of predicted toxin-antitoxin system
MRLLLDESVPVRLRDHFGGAHAVSTVGEMGWGGSTNGALLTLAAQNFDALITVDKNLRHQQNLQNLPLTVVVLSAKSNDLRTLLPLMGRLNSALAALTPRTLVVVGE